MSDDRDAKLQRQIEFIVNNQARFSTDIDALKEQVASIAQSVDILQTSVGKIENVVVRIANATVERFERVEKNLEELSNSTKQIAEAQANTDERLNILINVVERFYQRSDSAK